MDLGLAAASHTRLCAWPLPSTATVVAVLSPEASVTASEDDARSSNCSPRPHPAIGATRLSEVSGGLC